jgi:hypothetical protein
LIQRAGRVDRIGQKSEKIICYSFLPEDGIEKIINLRKRLAQRIEENAHVVGSDETFFDGDAVNLSNLYNEKSGILDEADDGEVDLASQAYQIWKTAIDFNPALERIIPDMPNVVYTAKKNEESPLKDGVIVYAQSSYDSDALVWLDKNGQIITHSHFAILNAARCAPTTEALPRLPEHHELVGEAVRLIKEDANNFTGTLGNTSGIRAKVYNRMKNYASTVFATEGLKKAIDDIFNYPLKTHAKNVLFGHVKTGISDKNLADLLITLREDSNLIVKPEKDNDHNQPQIICSLGIVSSPTP